VTVSTSEVERNFEKSCQRKFVIVSTIPLTTSEKTSTKMVNLPSWEGSWQKRKRVDVNVKP
jgi:hypothetical protein